MQPLKLPERQDLAHGIPVNQGDRLQEQKTRAEYLMARYRVPPEKVNQVVQDMDIAQKTFLAIEMAEKRQENWRFDYDPFAKL